MPELNNRVLTKTQKLQMTDLFSYAWRVGVNNHDQPLKCEFCDTRINRFRDHIMITAKEVEKPFCNWGELFEWLKEASEEVNEAKLASELRSERGVITAQPVGFSPSNLGRFMPSSSGDGEYTSFATRTKKLYEE